MVFSRYKRTINPITLQKIFPKFPWEKPYFGYPFPYETFSFYLFSHNLYHTAVQLACTEYIQPDRHQIFS